MTNTFNLYLIRHGESQNNTLPEAQRVSDPALTDLGQSQAESLAKRMSAEFNNTFHRVFTSAFLRTMQTLKPTAEQLELKPEIWTDLFEVGGCFSGYLPQQTVGQPGMTDHEIAAAFPRYQIPPDIDEHGWWKGRARETLDQAVIRADKVATQLLHDFGETNQSVACVIHADLIHLLLARLVPQQPELATTTIYNTSITQLAINVIADDFLTQVIQLNDTDHLQATQLST